MTRLERLQEEARERWGTKPGPKVGHRVDWRALGRAGRRFRAFIEITKGKSLARVAASTGISPEELEKLLAQGFPLV